jgi:hypothetical protein
MLRSRELRLTLFVIGELQRNGLIHVLYIKEIDS